MVDSSCYRSSRSRWNAALLLFLVLLGVTLTLLNRTPVTPVPLESPEHERYLTYLPHSGLSNQRIELQNALMLASLLNRTLIIPPVMLGAYPTWGERLRLPQFLAYLTKKCEPKSERNQLAAYTRKYINIGTHFCDQYEDYGTLPWTEFHDFSALSNVVRFRHMSATSFLDLATICNELGLNEYDVYRYNDRNLYDWIIYQDSDKAQEALRANSSFAMSFQGPVPVRVWSLEYWQQRPERVLQFESMFGMDRIALTDGHAWLRQKVENVFYFRQDTIVSQVALSIVNFLGGPDAFLAAHVRSGDSVFDVVLQENVNRIVDSMARRFDRSAQEEDNDVNRTTPFDQRAWGCQHVGDNAEKPLGRRTIVYMATSEPDPRQTLPLSPIYEQFPCTVTLADMPQHLLDPLKQVLDPNHAKSLQSLMIPIVDAIVASYGHQFYGTPLSTYSIYIAQLHDRRKQL